MAVDLGLVAVPVLVVATDSTKSVAMPRSVAISRLDPPDLVGIRGQRGPHGLEILAHDADTVRTGWVAANNCAASGARYTEANPCQVVSTLCPVAAKSRPDRPDGLRVAGQRVHVPGDLRDLAAGLIIAAPCRPRRATTPDGFWTARAMLDCALAAISRSPSTYAFVACAAAFMDAPVRVNTNWRSCWIASTKPVSAPVTRFEPASVAAPSSPGSGSSSAPRTGLRRLASGSGRRALRRGRCPTCSRSGCLSRSTAQRFAPGTACSLPSRRSGASWSSRDR